MIPLGIQTVEGLILSKFGLSIGTFASNLVKSERATTSLTDAMLSTAHWVPSSIPTYL